MARDTEDIHMGNVTNLKTRPQRFKEDQARTLKALLLPFLDDPDYEQEPIHRLLQEIERKTIYTLASKPLARLRGPRSARSSPTRSSCSGSTCAPMPRF